MSYPAPYAIRPALAAAICKLYSLRNAHCVSRAQYRASLRDRIATARAEAWTAAHTRHHQCAGSVSMLAAIACAVAALASEGKTMPEGAPARHAFHLARADGGRSVYTIRSERKNLVDFAAKVKAARAAFDCAPARKPNGAAKTPQGSPMRAAREMLKEGQRAESLQILESRGEVFFSSGRFGPIAQIVASRHQIDGREWLIARTADDGAIQVFHAASGLAAGVPAGRSLKTTTDALAWLDEMHDTAAQSGYCVRIEQAAARAKWHDQTAARRVWLAADGLTLQGDIQKACAAAYAEAMAEREADTTEPDAVEADPETLTAAHATQSTAAPAAGSAETADEAEREPVPAEAQAIARAGLAASWAIARAAALASLAPSNPLRAAWAAVEAMPVQASPERAEPMAEHAMSAHASHLATHAAQIGSAAGSPPPAPRPALGQPGPAPRIPGNPPGRTCVAPPSGFLDQNPSRRKAADAGMAARLEHGYDYAGQDLSGWQASEKFDGCRAYWSGSALYSRSGIECPLPPEWRTWLPTVPLDCELYAAPGGDEARQQAAQAIKTGRMGPHLRLIVFDAPDAPGDWLQRLAAARALVRPGGPVIVAEGWRVASTAEAAAHMRRIAEIGGEGLMLRPPGHRYQRGRTAQLLKLKPDPQGVIGHGLS